MSVSQNTSVFEEKINVSLKNTISLTADTSVGSVVWYVLSVFACVGGLFWLRSTMTKSSNEYNIYFIIQPLHFMSKIFGLSPLHIDPEHDCDNKRTCTCFHVSLATFMMALLIYGLYHSIIFTNVLIEPNFYASIRIVWAINIFATFLTSILSLIFAVTRNRNHIRNILSIISRVDSKLLHKNFEQNIYKQQRSHILAQMTVKFALYGTVSAFCAFSFYNGTWICFVYIVSKILATVINTVMILQYVNIVLIVKCRYQYMRRFLSEPTFTDDVIASTYKEHPLRQNSEDLFLSARCKVTTNRNSRNVCRIHDLQIAYSELYDVLHANNKSYGILILLEIITLLTSSVPVTYFGIIVLKEAVFNNGDFYVYLKGVVVMCLCFSQLLTFLWLTTCCHSTAEEIHDTIVCIHKLLLFPNRLFWTTADLKRLAYQLSNVKVEFSVCGFFTLNLQLLCGSVGIMFTYILVLNQFNR
jgi:hypothetical protein